MALHEVRDGKKSKILDDAEYKEYRMEHSGPFGCLLGVLGLACLGGSFWVVYKAFGLIGIGFNGWGIGIALVLAAMVFGGLEKILKRLFF